jgi:3-demethoxyubiquinol 3-hydroxylase
MKATAPDRSLPSLSVVDRLVLEIDACLRTLAGVTDTTPRPSPADAPADARTGSAASAQSGRARPASGSDEPPTSGDETARRHIAGLMRVNHAGEVAAQALYRGQALAARSDELGARLDAARREEIDHLLWCRERLRELGSQPSRFGLLWYSGAFLMGALSGAVGDRFSLGFLAETERQVAEHLDQHLARLPQEDRRSRRVLTVMREEEDAHRRFAEQQGGITLPWAIRGAMRLTAGVMKWVAYRG